MFMFMVVHVHGRGRVYMHVRACIAHLQQAILLVLYNIVQLHD